MEDQSGINQELLEEISTLKQRIKKLEQSENERLRVEKALKESETLLQTYMENAPDAIYTSDMKGTFLYGNRKSEEIIGYSRDELIGKSYLELNVLSEKSLNKAIELLQTSMEGKPTGPDEIELINKEGHLIPVEINTSVVQSVGQKIILGFVRDITERKIAEEKLNLLLFQLRKKNRELNKAYEDLKRSESMLIQSEKMASLGQLSAGIAHELKNPLSIILQGISYIQSSVEDGTLIDACDRIKKSAIRADIVIQSLLSFSRQAPPSFTEDDINALIEEALTMVEHQMNLRNIEVIRNYFLHIPKVRVDSNQIREVFINTLINAADAMKDGGTITLTTTAGTDRDGEPCVRAVITDTGTGIPGEILKKVFDPFFTTKTDSGGTGLGLSVTKGIVDRHHGSIAISSEEGKGTTVTITLPCNPFEKEGHYNG